MTAEPETAQRADADRALKARHAAMWALGDYPALAGDLIADLGHVLVRACKVGPGDRVLDVAAGSGNAAITAARAGADVVACDLTPELLAAGQQQASRLGVQVEWRQGDAEALPFADGSFDVVMSCVGVMFAPHHQASARELVRVCRPGGTIGLLNWTPDGFIGRMFATMKPYAAPPPPGVQPAPLWGNEEHVRGLLGGAVSEMTATRDSLEVSLFGRPEDFRDYFKARYGPVVAAYQRIGDDAGRVAALDRDLAELARRHDYGVASTVMDWEYLLVTARRQS
jgi:SAM-dependent methyltransferase